jgi:hypothetical protein
MEFVDLDRDMFRVTWSANNVLGEVVGQKTCVFVVNILIVYIVFPCRAFNKNR